MKCFVLMGGIFNIASVTIPDVLRRMLLRIFDIQDIFRAEKNACMDIHICILLY